MSFTPEPRKRILVLDFDGVIHSYTSGWVQHNIIPDPPVPGAFFFIKEALKHFAVHIYSSRSSKTMGIDAMRQWFLDHGLEPDVVEQLQFPTEKPPAFLQIDDRALTFTGAWPDMRDLIEFQTWQHQQLPQLHLADLEVLLILIRKLRGVDGRGLNVSFRSVLQQWVLDQIPPGLRGR